MTAVIIVIAAALIALVAGKKTGSANDGPASRGTAGVAPSGTLAAVGSPKVTVRVDGKLQGQTIVLPANADHIKISTSWAVSNSTPMPHLGGMKLRWIHERGGLPDDDWAEWLPYFDAATGLSGLVEDDLLKDTGTPLRVSQSPKMLKIAAASSRTFVVDLVIPGPGRSDKLAKFWKDHNGANFKLEPELTTDFQPDQGPSGTQKFLAGGLLLGDLLGPVVFGGATEVAGSAESTAVYSLKKVTLASFMTIAFQAVAKSTAKVTIQEPAAGSYFTGAKIPYKATVALTGGTNQPKVVPLVKWIYRVTPEGQDKPSGWAQLSGTGGEISFSQPGLYEFQAAVPETDQWTGHVASKSITVRKALKPQAKITIIEPSSGNYQAGKPVSYRARVDGLGFTPPVIWQYRLSTASSSPGSTGGWVFLGSQLADSFTPAAAGEYTLAVTVNETAQYRGDFGSVSITVAPVPKPSPKFAIGDHVAVSVVNGIVNGMDWDSGRSSWFYSFLDQFSFLNRIAEGSLSLYVEPVITVVPEPIVSDGGGGFESPEFFEPVLVTLDPVWEPVLFEGGGGFESPEASEPIVSDGGGGFESPEFFEPVLGTLDPVWEPVLFDGGGGFESPDSF